MIDTAVFAAEYPFQSRFWQHNGLRYHYLDEGPRDAPVLLMLHGNPTWSFYYRHLTAALRNQYRVIVPDHMGCGLSDKPQHYAYTLQQHIDNLAALLDHLQINRFSLLVHDWGGAIGMGYAVEHPEAIETITIFNTAAFFIPRLPKRIAVCRVPALGAMLVRGLNGFVLGSLLFGTAQHRRFSRAARAGYVAPYHSWAARVAIHRFVQDIPMETGHPTRRTLNRIEAGLGRLNTKPMLICWGERDFCFTSRDFLPEWETLFPQAEVHRFGQAGHFVLEDAPEAIMPPLRAFLTRHLL